MHRIRKGDTVIVRTGKDKGRQGIVLKILDESKKKAGRQSLRAIVEGVNIVKRHTKATQNQAGGIVKKEAPIEISNIGLLNKSTGKIGKVGFKTLEDGRKVRFFKSTGEVVDV